MLLFAGISIYVGRFHHQSLSQSSDIRLSLTSYPSHPPIIHFHLHPQLSWISRIICHQQSIILMGKLRTTTKTCWILFFLAIDLLFLDLHRLILRTVKFLLDIQQRRFSYNGRLSSVSQFLMYSIINGMSWVGFLLPNHTIHGFRSFYIFTCRLFMGHCIEES